MTEETPRLPAIRIRSDTRLTRHSFTPRSADIMWSSGTTPKQNRDKKSILGSVFYEAKGNNGFVDFAIDDRPLTNGCARLPQLMGILGGDPIYIERRDLRAWNPRRGEKFCPPVLNFRAREKYRGLENDCIVDSGRMGGGGRVIAMEPSSRLVTSMEGLIGFETIEIRMVDKIIVFCFLGTKLTSCSSI